MSLINCPECGREKVSDTAIACPSCGFGIREYFEKQKSCDGADTTATKDFYISEKKAEDEEILSSTVYRCVDNDSVSQSEERLNDYDDISDYQSAEPNTHIEIPKVKFPIGSLIGVIIGLIFFFSGLDKINVSENEMQFIMEYGAFNPIPSGMVLLVYGILVISTAMYFIIKAGYRYFLSQNNYEAYVDIITKEKGEKDEKKPDMPLKPIFSKLRVAGIVTGIGFIILPIGTMNGREDSSLDFFVLVIWGLVIIGCVLYYYWKKVERYNLAKDNYYAYEQLLQKEKEETERQRKAEREERERKRAQIPKCPNCGSSNVRNISTMNRAVSVEFFGLASSKIGKQYECKNCNHKF